MGTNYIENKFDYSTIIPSVEYITYLVEYCDSVFKHFTELLEDEEEKNKDVNPQQKIYNYKRTFGEYFSIDITGKNYMSTKCSNLQQFKDEVKKGTLKDVLKLTISLNLDYRKGNIQNLEQYDNDFTIKFKPYEIEFIRKSNHSENYMNEVEKNINELLKRFPSVNTIFQSK